MANSKSNVNGNTVTGKPPPVDAATLPSAAASDLVLVIANPKEYAQCSRLNAEEWKGPLTVDQYMNREKHLLNQDLTRDGGATGWILTSPQLLPNADGTRPILASCESNLAHAYVARNGKLDKIISHGIGSVFTRPEHRGKGYAGRMLTELGKNLMTYQQPNGNKSLFSVLYSDIGTKFYSRLGWKAFASTHIHLAPMDSSTYEFSRKELPVVEDLATEDLPGLPAASIVEAELLSQSQQREDTPFIAFRPDMDHFQWHHAREEYVSATLGLSDPKVKGAIHRPTGAAVIWTRVFSAEQEDWQLHILHSIIPPAIKSSAAGMRALSALLLRAQHEASKCEMLAGVEVWDPSELIIGAAQSLRTEAHDKLEVIYRDQEHICSLRWTSASHSVDDVVWDYKQKYAWC
jgi:GNAT superfamily N-acetyltransferase